MCRRPKQQASSWSTSRMWLPRLDRTADTEPSRTDRLGRWKVASEKNRAPAVGSG
jgi:hypothetical protein